MQNNLSKTDIDSCMESFLKVAVARTDGQEVITSAIFLYHRFFSDYF